jgi:hypothetical protein
VVNAKLVNMMNSKTDLEDSFILLNFQVLVCMFGCWSGARN